MANPEEKQGEKGDQTFDPFFFTFAMGEIKGTVENLRTDLREWKDTLKSDMSAGDLSNSIKIADLETRMRVLEKWKWMVAGAAAAGGLAGGKLIDFIGKISQ